MGTEYLLGQTDKSTKVIGKKGRNTGFSSIKNKFSETSGEKGDLIEEYSFYEAIKDSNFGNEVNFESL